MIDNLTLEQLRDFKFKLIGIIKRLQRLTRKIDKEIKHRFKRSE